MDTYDHWDVQPECDDQHEIAAFLGQHFGDGTLYLADPDDGMRLACAKQLGYACEEGYLTADGRRLWRGFAGKLPAAAT